MNVKRNRILNKMIAKLERMTYVVPVDIIDSHLAPAETRDSTDTASQAATDLLCILFKPAKRKQIYEYQYISIL